MRPTERDYSLAREAAVILPRIRLTSPPSPQWRHLRLTKGCPDGKGLFFYRAPPARGAAEAAHMQRGFLSPHVCGQNFWSGARARLWSVVNTWGQLVWNDNSDTWDITIGDGPVHKAATIEAAEAYCKEAARNLVKALP